MDISLMQSFSKSNLWHLLLPEFVCLGAVFLFVGLSVLNFSVPRGVKLWGVLVPTHLIAIGCLFLPCFSQHLILFGGLIDQTSWSRIIRGLLLLSSLGICCLWIHFEKKNPDVGKREFLILELLATVGFMIVSQMQHLGGVFVALEMGSICSCFLICSDRNNHPCISASLKYLVLNGISSAILLIGITLIYGYSAHCSEVQTLDALDYSQLNYVFTNNSLDLWGKAGILLLLGGISFKLGAVPFQIWIPDVYQKAPSPATAFFAISSKIAGFSVLYSLITGPFMSLDNFIRPILIGVGIFTILIGSVGGLSQSNLKRIVGFSSITHTGFLLIAIATIENSIFLVSLLIIFYLISYFLATISVLSVVAIKSENLDDEQRQLLVDHDGLYQKSPLLAIVLAIGLASLGGIPPLAGFIAKFLVLLSAFQLKLYFAIIVMIIGSVFSVYYYFNWIREIFFSSKVNDEKVEPALLTTRSQISLILITAILLFLGAYQGFFLHIF